VSSDGGLTPSPELREALLALEVDDLPDGAWRIPLLDLR
jgi:hypothetical protein